MLWSQIKLNSVLGSFISVLNPSKTQFSVCEIAIMIPVRSAVVRISSSRVTAEGTSEINNTSKHPNENIIIVWWWCFEHISGIRSEDMPHL